MTPPIDDRTIGVPDGVLARAAALLAPAVRLVPGGRNGATETASARWLAAELLTAPRRLEPDWPDPPDPVPVGDGWVHSTVVDEDRDGFDELLRSRSWEPEELAATAQEMRLPITPYRAAASDRRAITPSGSASLPHCADQVQPNDLTGSVVVDLSTHWAGPLATSLLARSGATVIKVDPGCRPDGFRSRPRLYRHLNDGKRILDLDLRVPVDRARFETLISGADLLVESFSRRVMANLDYHPGALRQLQPKICTLGIRAFPADRPERDWVSYGPGVHAASGLGLRDHNRSGSASHTASASHTGSDSASKDGGGNAGRSSRGRPKPAPVAYPDLLAGLEAFNTGAALLAADDRPAEAEVSLLGAIEPLVASGGSRFTGREGDDG